MGLQRVGHNRVIFTFTFHVMQNFKVIASPFQTFSSHIIAFHMNPKNGVMTLLSLLTFFKYRVPDGELQFNKRPQENLKEKFITQVMQEAHSMP